MKSNGSEQEVSEKKLGTFTRHLIPTEDRKNGAEGVFLVFLVWTIIMRVVVVSSHKGWGQLKQTTELETVH